MAGDWIKLEHATLQKPEVHEIAEVMNLSRREAIGLLAEYFCWLDLHMADSRNGLVTHVSRKSVDEALHEPGFSAMLEQIGWAKFDDEKRTLTVTNWDRHNGKTAKSRALGQKRAQRFRNDSVTLEALPEKRREEKRLKTNTKASALTRCPPDFAISDRVKSWAVEKGHNHLDAQFEAFMSYVRRKQPKYADWDEALMTCIREDWAKLGEHPKGNGAAWWSSEKATEAKARELGMWPARAGESWNDFRGRIRARLGGA